MVSACDPDLPAFYTDVAKFRGWIDERDKIIGEQNLLKQSSCGAVRKNNYTNEIEQAVVNQYPWNVLLEYTRTRKDSTEQLLTCSGVLVHPRYVLTVGHCATGMLSKYKLTSVRVGEFNINTPEDLDASVPAKSFTSQSVDIEKVLPHPQMNNPLYSNDLALIKLKHEAGTGKENVLPICLPSVDEYKEEGVTLTGWKRSKRLFPKLEQDAMNISSAAQCQNQYSALQLDLPSADDMLCAQYKSRAKGRCHNYAAGSPLQYIKVVDQKPRYFLAGLMMFSLPHCRPNATEVFVSLVGSTKWIKNTILIS
ncbi:serine protease easter-like [Anopheles ziemanni]|uniref:serine protease easter-like n=1 Tax=Anopheles coustani TaxID=139045 RepID=UPI0026594606|nr:serine protease easter-like [Anopheles coustani]XP_058178236.1 serine protease easter-like [Anopheles ziemanni]